MCNSKCFNCHALLTNSEQQEFQFNQSVFGEDILPICRHCEGVRDEHQANLDSWDVDYHLSDGDVEGAILAQREEYL